MKDILGICEDEADLHSNLVGDHGLEPGTLSLEIPDTTIKVESSSEHSKTTTETNCELLRGDDHTFIEHNYSMKETKIAILYNCDDCGYSTSRKNTFMNHLAETCKLRRGKGLLAAKDKQCKYCFKMMRHNALRAHLRHFINSLKANRKPKGKHSSISLEEFNNYLEEIKL